MINSITIKKVASYDDSGANIAELKRLNFFFGFNGSGKSTIAKFIYNLSLEPNQRNEDFAHCSQIGFNPNNHQILTFDERFTEENFINNDNLKGVFSLDETNEIIDSQISEENTKIIDLEDRIKEKAALINRLTADQSSKQTELLNHCWSKRTTFATFTKLSLPHGGSKPNHLSEIRGKQGASLTTIPTIQQLKDTYDSLYEKEVKNILTTVNFQLYRSIRKLENRLQDLLQEIIVGNEDVDITSLINQLNARNWVESGIQFLPLTKDICPFCQENTITESLREQFEKLFDQSYREKIEKIKLFEQEYKTLTDAFLSNILNIQNEFNPNNLVSAIYLSLQKLFSENIETIVEKIGNSNERKSISFLSIQKKDLSVLIKKIKENNLNYSELDNNKKTLVSNIWTYIASECKDKIKKFDDRAAQSSTIKSLAEQLILTLRDKIILSKSNIEILRTQTVNTQTAVDNINTILKNAGFDGFEIAEKDKVNNISQYYLKRPSQTTENNRIFKSLSEGEKNFISFLYFHQLCSGTDDIQTNGNKKKIIVIDDPVSSLDSQALFVVSTLIHNLIARKGNLTAEKQQFKNDNITQVIILTHNLYFYKEVSFDRRPTCTDFWHYKVSKINSKSEVKGQRHKAIQDDYSLLWNTLKELKENLPENASLNIVIANSMRRIIESYVNFLGFGKDSWASLYNLDENEPTYYIKCAFISIINDESHKTSALDGIYYQKIINEQPRILFDIFKEIFRTIGKEHYEMMFDEQLD